MRTIDLSSTRVLAIYAHPDDMEMAAGGLIAASVLAGAKVKLVVVTQGDKGHLPNTLRDSVGEVDKSERKIDEGPKKSHEHIRQLIDIRKAEAVAGAGQLGVSDVEFLQIADGDVSNDQSTRGELVRIIREYKPEIVVTHDPTSIIVGTSYINHRDHRQLGEAVLDAVAPAAAIGAYFPQMGDAHQVRQILLSGTSVPDSYADISKVVENKLRAILCHQSQLQTSPEWVSEVVHQRAAVAGEISGSRYAELYREVSLVTLPFVDSA